MDKKIGCCELCNDCFLAILKYIDDAKEEGIESGKRQMLEKTKKLINKRFGDYSAMRIVKEEFLERIEELEKELEEKE